MFKNAYRAYLVLGGLIALIVGSLLFFRALEARAPVDIEDADSMSTQTELNMQLMQERLSDEIAGDTTGGGQERMDSPLGLAMFRKCIEWTEFYENHPSEDTEANRDEACGEYRRYVDTGEVPET